MISTLCVSQTVRESCWLRSYHVSIVTVIVSGSSSRYMAYFWRVARLASDPYPPPRRLEGRRPALDLASRLGIPLAGWFRHHLTV